MTSVELSRAEVSPPPPNRRRLPSRTESCMLAVFVCTTHTHIIVMNGVEVGGD